MARSIGSKVAAALVLGALGTAIVPGCVIRIGTGDGSDTQTDGSGSGTGEPSGGGTTDPGGGGLTPEEEVEQMFAEMDPQELALASAKARFTSAYLVGTIESLGYDPATLDDAALADLMVQYAPLAATEADKWIATLDPSLLAADPSGKFECTQKFGCKYLTPCTIWPPAVPHMCKVTDCGDAGCKGCPAWIAEALSHLLFKSWCSYVCLEHNVTYPKTVAVGVGWVSFFGGSFGGPMCFDP